MPRNLNKQPLNFEPMVALSADFRREYGKELDGCKVPDTYKRLLGGSMPPGADLWRNYNGVLDAIESIAAEAASDPILLGEIAKMELRFVRGQRRLLRRYIRARFGIKVAPAFWLYGEKELSFPPSHPG